MIVAEVLMPSSLISMALEEATEEWSREGEDLAAQIETTMMGTNTSAGIGTHHGGFYSGRQILTLSAPVFCRLL
jgi:hypothetical protein